MKQDQARGEGEGIRGCERRAGRREGGGGGGGRERRRRGRGRSKAPTSAGIEFIGNYFSRTCGPLAGIEGGATTGWTTSVGGSPGTTG